MMVGWLRDVVCVPRMQTLCNYKLWTAEGAISERGTVLRLGSHLPLLLVGRQTISWPYWEIISVDVRYKMSNVVQILSHYEVKVT